jgi:hypothetical protein
MTPDEMFESATNASGIEYAVSALSHPNDDTYRKNLAKYLDTKGFDLISKDRQLYIGDRNSNRTKPITPSFLGEIAGSAPEIVGSIVGGVYGGVPGAVAGSVGGDAVQQWINSYFLDEDLEPEQRALESGKSAGLSLGGEVLGNTVGRAITPLRNLNKTAMNENIALANKYDIPLTPASATGHKGLAQFEEVMQKGTLGGKNIAKAKSDEIEAIENTTRDLLENKMGATGDISDSGADFAYNVSKQQKIAQEYFDQQYGELVKSAGVTEIPITSFKGVANEILAKSKKIPALENGVDKLAERITQSPDSLTYQEYQNLRSAIGAKIKDASVTGESGSVEAYKQLYGAINNDFDDVFKGTQFHSSKRTLDNQFKKLYKEQFEDNFTKGVTGAGGRSPIDEERIGGLIANSSSKARVGANTADSAFVRPDEQAFINSPKVAELLNQKQPEHSMSAAADYLLNKSTAPDGGMSLAKMRTNLRKATGVDELFKANKPRSTNKLFSKSDIDNSDLKVMKDDIIKLIEISGKNKQIGNHSGTAYMNELIKMKNDPWSALIGFASDRAMDLTYKRKLFQKWLTNGVISKPQYQQLINANTQTLLRDKE